MMMNVQGSPKKTGTLFLYALTYWPIIKLISLSESGQEDFCNNTF